VCVSAGRVCRRKWAIKQKIHFALCVYFQSLCQSKFSHDKLFFHTFLSLHTFTLFPDSWHIFAIPVQTSKDYFTLVLPGIRKKLFVMILAIRYIIQCVRRVLEEKVNCIFDSLTFQFQSIYCICICTFRLWKAYVKK